MPRTEVSQNLYPHPFSKAYWRDALGELKSTKMLVIAALLTALRIALKPIVIPLGPQLTIPFSQLANALGAMIFGPIVAIPAAIISDTVGFMLFPTGDYFFPFVLMEVASSLICALLLYRAPLTTTRVVLVRFFICTFVNIFLQTSIFAWQYVWMGNPEGAKKQILGMFTVARVFKNLSMFPLEAVVLNLFLKMMLPVVRRAHLIYDKDATLVFTKKQVVTLIALFLVGVCSATAYLTYRYNNTSRTADYSKPERMEKNQQMAQLVIDRTDDWDDETVVCVVDGAYRPIFGKETDYTVSVYVLDEEAFAAGQAADPGYTMDTLWKFSKSGPRKDKYQSLIKVGTMTMTQNEKNGEISDFAVEAAE